MRALTVRTTDLDILEQYANSALPSESCALLLGHGTSILKILYVKNSDEGSANSFSIDPKDLLAAYAVAEDQGFHITGIFHSHPGPPRPSSTDIRFMEINGVVWLIYSTTEKRFAAHYFDSGHVLPVQIEADVK